MVGAVGNTSVTGSLYIKKNNNQFHKLLTEDWVPFGCMLVPCGSRGYHNMFIQEDTLKAWGMAFLFWGWLFNYQICHNLNCLCPFCLCTGALQIENSEESDQGKYECVATNSAGTRYSAPANLYVRGKSSFHPRRSLSYCPKGSMAFSEGVCSLSQCPDHTLWIVWCGLFLKTQQAKVMDIFDAHWVWLTFLEICFAVYMVLC